MADPLSIAASVVGVVVPALHGTRLLLDDLQKIKDAPNALKRIEDDVRSVETALTTLKAVEDREWSSLGNLIAEQSRTTISSCTQACDLFRTDLQRWTVHSEGGKLVWRDRAKVGFFKQGQMKAMLGQLQNCKLSINNVVSVANLYSSIRNSHTTEDIKRLMSTNQAEVKAAVTTADRQLTVLESKLEEINLSSDDEDASWSSEGKFEAVRQLEEERKALESSRKLLEELLSKSQEEAVAKAVAGCQGRSATITFGNQNSGFQAGTIDGPVSGITFGSK